MAAAARVSPAASPHASTAHSRRPLLSAHVCRGVSHRFVFIDEELIDVTDIVFFGIQAAVPIQFSGLRGVHAQARGDARPACPSERLQAHMRAHRILLPPHEGHMKALHQSYQQSSQLLL